MIIHVVQRGETLWRISNLYGVSINEIVRANQLADPNVLVVGQSLVIPTQDNIHIVRPGESLWLIANRYGVSLQDLIRENQIQNPSLIYPGQLIRIPRPTIEVNGYLTRIGTAGEQIIRYTGEFLTYLSMFSYSIQPDGGLTTLDDESVLEIARPMGITPLMTITNFTESGFSSDLAHAVLSSSAVQERLLSNIINIMDEKGFEGLNIDFEYVYPEDRQLYNQFLARAANVMQANNYSISTALAPKVRADQPGLLYEAHDYPVHGELADFVVLMTYEWGWSGGPPWAIAPINEVRRVLDYAVTAIPRSKILMGIPLYGRDWRLPFTPGTRAATITLQEALRRAIRYGAQIQYNELYQSPYFRYYDETGTQHEVWFEDARSFQAKYNTVKEYGLRGVSYWELNLEAPQNWPVLVNNFRVHKL